MSTFSTAKVRSKESPYAQISAQHNVIGAYFLGPQAENYEHYRGLLNGILDDHREARQTYHTEDGAFVTQGMQSSPPFKISMANLRYGVDMLSNLLRQHSPPFWSPRYSAHMCMDTSMPASLAYFMTMLYNPNNVSVEASPITTEIELRAGRQLCRMVGYQVPPEEQSFPNRDDIYLFGSGKKVEAKTDETDDIPEAWGHITCDGTVANLESIWAARNMKFYPLSFRNALSNTDKYPILKPVANTFEVYTCQAFHDHSKGKKNFMKLTTWELLNLKSPTILEIPERLENEFGISSEVLEKIMEEYTIQSVGKDELERQYNIKMPIQYAVSSTRHYSWPKGAAIAGFGSKNMVNIEVDNNGRLNPTVLEAKLKDCIFKNNNELPEEDRRAMYAVVAIVGTTEEGAVDPLDEVLKLRLKYEKEHGLSFLVHVDAAWGGYFASMVDTTIPPERGAPIELPPRGEGVPSLSLKPSTVTQIKHIQHADSMTIDPHKSGYIPYPAGGLCYRDGRMRYLITWTSPYITKTDSDNQKPPESIGIYGVEGSKPGAAAAATFLSNMVIGTGLTGYGRLLGEVRFTCARLFAHWAAMKTDSFFVEPFNELPGNKEESKKFIRERILNRPNEELFTDYKAMKFLEAIGSDLNINAFACNFYNKDGTPNDDVDQANKLNRRIVERLSITTPDKDPADIPLFLTSTEFLAEQYGSCAEAYKKRLGVAGAENLFVLRNVVMTPFPTDGNFVAQMAHIFQMVVEEEVKISQDENEIAPVEHKFFMQGTDKLFLVYQPMFGDISSRQQAILSVELNEKDMTEYKRMKENNPDWLFQLTSKKMDFDEIRNKKAFTADVEAYDNEGKLLAKVIENTPVSNVAIIVFKDLNSKEWAENYPNDTPFYLYGTKTELHMEHILVRAPNIQLSASNINCPFKEELLSKVPLDEKSEPLVLRVKGAFGQPFRPGSSLAESNTMPFTPGCTFDVKVYTSDGKNCLIENGKVTLSDQQTNVFVEKQRINDQPYGAVPSKEERYFKWKRELDFKIGFGGF